MTEFKVYTVVYVRGLSYNVTDIGWIWLLFADLLVEVLAPGLEQRISLRSGKVQLILHYGIILEIENQQTFKEIVQH